MNADKKNQLIERIKTIDGLEDEERSALLELLRTKKSYGLVWENKPEYVEEKMRNKVPVLVEDKDKSLTEAGPEAPNHVLIEGDNLEALTTLAYTHAGKIDVIYIDPPYNTGNKDFIYYDDFNDDYRALPYVEREDSYRHSKWLSFMNRRLKIAKKLLKEDGLIWISIDENELFNLKMICDSLFNESNFRSLVTVIANPGGRDYGGIAKQTEYILVYANSEFSVIQKVPDSSHKFDLKDEWGPFELRELRNRNTKFNDGNRPNLCYPFFVNPNETDEHGLYSIALEQDDKYTIKVMPLKSKGIQTVWRWGKEEKSRKNLNINIKAKLKKDGTFMIVEKYRDESVMIRNVWQDKEFRTENGSLQIKEIIGEGKFDYPKPLEIPHLILNTINNKNAYVLDFFAGSGTTLHAVMKLNAEDGGRRRCILVTNNENGICEKVTYERNKRVIDGYTNPKGDHVEGLLVNNLRYFRTSLIDKDNSHSSRRALFMALTDVLCFKEDIYHEEFQFGDLSLSGKSKMLRYFAEGDRKMLIIYDSRVIKFIVNEISKQEKTENPIKVFIYADGMYPYTEDFQDVLDRIELIPMPYAFTHAIKGCIPEPTEQRVDQTELSEKEQQELLTEANEAENKNN